MRKKVFQLILLLTCVSVFAPTAFADSRANILVVGDSLSAGFGLNLEDTWVALMQARLDSKGYGYRMVNASISGDTTGNGLRRLPRAIDLHQPEIVIIELGANDGLRGLPVEVMQQNLAEMIRTAKAGGARVVLAGMLMPPNYGDEYTESFAAAFPALARKFDVPLIPFFLDGIALNPSLLQADGLHPTAEAQPLLLETVWATLEPELRKQSAANSAGTGQAVAAH
jgi:acyl-CoA thioesterase-1